jgi:hypothetical protein
VDDEIRILDHLVSTGVVDLDRREALVESLTRPPDRDAWARFTHLFGLGLGTASVLAGVVYFVAFNWSELGFFPKLGLALGGVVACASVAAWAGPRSLVGSLASIGGAVLSGAALVVYSQHWQSGADPWTLFAAWSALAVPFVLAARTPAAWALWFVLLDATVLLRVQGLGDEVTAGVVTALGLVHPIVGRAFAGGWLEHVLRLAGVLALTVVGEAFILDREWMFAPAYFLLLVGAAATQAAYLLRAVGGPAAGLAWTAASVLVFTEVVVRLVDWKVELVGVLLIPGSLVLVLTVGGFGWLVGAPRLRGFPGGEA